jgi:site-specific recombinase XerD
MKLGASTLGAIMTAEQLTLHDWLHLVQAEYLEMPGQQLTRSQIKRLWGLDSNMCDAVLQELVDAHFLRHALCDAYVLDGASC